MRRAYVLLLPLAACSFRSPTASGDGGGGDDAPSDGTPASPCDLGDTFEKGKQPARTVYVSKTPGPGTPDGSELNPFLTIGAAVPSIAPGTRILLGPGEYTGVTITDKQGTADAPIWLEGPIGPNPARILVGGSGTGLHLVRPRYWVIRDLEIAMLTQQPGINVDDGGTPTDVAKYVVIDRVNVGAVTGSCIQISGATDVMIRDSTLGSCGRGVFLVGVQHATIGRMNIGGINTAGVALAGGSADIEVRQSVIANVENGIGVWIGGDSSAGQFRPPLSSSTGNAEATNVRVFDNVIRDVRNAIQCSNCTSSLVAHNLIRRANTFLLMLHQPYTDLGAYAFAPAGGVRFVNNAIELGPSANAFEDSGSGTAPGTCTFSHNMWRRDGGSWTPDLPTTEVMGFYNRSSGYVDGGWLCASANSPAAGAGVPVPEVQGTLKGACRGAPPSIGPGEPEPGC